MANDVIPHGEGAAPGDWENLLKMAGTILGPLAQNQAEVQKRAIEADLEKHRLMSEHAEREAKRRFVFTMVIVAVVAAGLGAFIWVGQYQFAKEALIFVAGALVGAGGLKAVQQVRR
jgi:hypothetical protein